MANNYKLSLTAQEIEKRLGEVPDKVDKVDGMGLSSNDYTSAEKDKLSGIAAGAAAIDDSAASTTSPWSSLQTLDAICPPFEVAGNPVECEPVERYPLQVIESFVPMQSGSGDAGVDNIRPISGRTGLELMCSGKNLANARLYNVQFVVSNVYLRANNTYTLSVTNTPTGLYFSSADMLTNYAANYNSKSLTYTVAFNGEYMIRAYYQNNDASLDCNMQLELGSTATAYEPYQGYSYAIQFGQTIYGGSYDWRSGVLTAEWQSVVFDGTNRKASINEGASNTLFYYKLDADGLHDISVAPICSHFGIGSMVDTGVFYNPSFPNVVYINFGWTMTEDEANEWLAAQYAAGTPVQFAYKLATPQTIQLGGTAIPAVAGTNVLHADGDLIVRGAMDIKAYIAQAIAGAQSATAALSAAEPITDVTLEPEPVADVEHELVTGGETGGETE